MFCSMVEMNFKLLSVGRRALFFGLALLCPLYSLSLAAHSEEIKIGIISSLDPIGAPWSVSANLGFAIAAEEINAAGGVNGRNVKLIYEDDRFDARKAISAYRKLTRIDAVDILIGPQFEQTLTPVIPLAETDKRLLITTITTTPVSSEKYGWIIHSVPSDRLGGECLAKEIKSDQRKHIAFLIPEEAYSQTFSGFIKAGLEKETYTSLNYSPDTSDYRSLLLRVRAIKPDALVTFFVTPEQASSFFRQMSELGIDLPVYSNEVLHTSESFIEQSGKLAQGTVYCLADLNESDSAIKSLLEKMEERPSLPLIAVLSYDTLKWLASILRRVGTDNVDIKNEIYKMSYPGLYTTYSFDPYGDLENVAWSAYTVTTTGVEQRYTAPIK